MKDLNGIEKPKTPDGRNIRSFYWYWEHKDILADLDKNQLPFAVLVQNLSRKGVFLLWPTKNG